MKKESILLGASQIKNMATAIWLQFLEKVVKLYGWFVVSIQFFILYNLYKKKFSAGVIRANVIYYLSLEILIFKTTRLMKLIVGLTPSSLHNNLA